jgi:hypothetical protein
MPARFAPGAPPISTRHDQEGQVDEMGGILGHLHTRVVFRLPMVRGDNGR